MKCNVEDRLSPYIGFWEYIRVSAFIIHCIKEGYKIPFDTTPSGASFKNNHSGFQAC